MTHEVPRGSELIDRLVAIGVAEREAKLYVHLLLHGPTRASEAAAAVRLKRTETYRALEALATRGFVTAHLTKPVVYEAAAPDPLFAELLAGHEQRRTELESLREQVAAAAASARDRRAAGGARHGYKIIQGRRAILSTMEPMIRNARSSIVFASTAFAVGSVSAQNRAYQAVLRRARDGFPVKVLVRESPGLLAALQPLLEHPSVSLRFLTHDTVLRSIIADGWEIVHWLVSDPAPGVESREDVAMWTNAPDFIRGQETLLAALWDAGREPPRP